MPQATSLFAFLSSFVLLSLPSFAQSPMQCAVNTTPPVVRIEGLAERLGEIVLSCAGGTPGLVITGNLGVILNVLITNRLTPGTPGDILATIDTGSGPMPATFSAILNSPSYVSLNGLSFTTPPSGGVIIHISNLRGAVLSVPPGTNVIANLSLNSLSTMSLLNNSVVVAIAQRGLLTNSSSTVIRCVGSPLPSSISMSSLFAAGTHFESTRLTEGFASAFLPKGPLETAGTRFLIAYTKLPAGTVLYVPDVVAGSDALQPTGGGDLGQPQSAGKYTPGSGTLLLSRVNGADATGNGGTPVFVPPASGPALSFDSATQLAITNNSAYVVYEVMDSNPVVAENAQFPTFVGLSPANLTPGSALESVSFAPVSSDATANTSAPIPRFTAGQPPSDCQAVGDCSAPYFPVLSVFAAPEVFTAFMGGLPLQLPGYIAIQNPNSAQSVLNWTATVIYQSGADWILLDNPSGLNNGSVRVFIQSQKLAVGTYNATVTIDAGAAGRKNIPVTLTVMALPPQPPPPPPPVNTPGITAVTNGADFLPGPVVSGSIAAIKGSKFSGKSISVTFDGVPATIQSSGDTQITVLVPDGLTGKTSSQVVVTVDGLNSAPATVPLALVAPAIFADVTMNQDYTLNNATNGGPVGSTVHVFVTGLAQAGGAVLVKIHDREDLVPTFVGSLPGWPGIWQVDATVPGDLPAMTTTMLVCELDAAGSKVCSAPARLALADAQP